MPFAQLSVGIQSFPGYPQANWTVLVLIPGWVGLCTFQDPVGLSKEISCEGRSFSCLLNTHRCLQLEILRLYFPTLGSWGMGYVSLPRCSSQFICRQTWDCPLHQPLPCLESFLPHLPISTPPTGTDECFFFNLLVVRLPYSLIFLAVLIIFCF